MVWSTLDLYPHAQNPYYNVPVDVVGLPLLPMMHICTRFPARKNKPWAQVGSRWSLPDTWNAFLKHDNSYQLLRNFGIMFKNWTWS